MASTHVCLYKSWLVIAGAVLLHVYLVSTSVRTDIMGGYFKNTSRGVSGRISIVETTHYRISNFSYNGRVKKKCGAFFAGLYRPGSNYSWRVLEYTFAGMKNLSCDRIVRMKNMELFLPVPDTLTVLDFQAVAVMETWNCRTLGVATLPTSVHGHDRFELLDLVDYDTKAMVTMRECMIHAGQKCPQAMCLETNGFPRYPNETQPYYGPFRGTERSYEERDHRLIAAGDSNRTKAWEFFDW